MAETYWLMAQYRFERQQSEWRVIPVFDVTRNLVCWKRLWVQLAGTFTKDSAFWLHSEAMLGRTQLSPHNAGFGDKSRSAQTREIVVSPIGS